MLMLLPLLLLSVPRLDRNPFAETKKGGHDYYSPAFSMRHERGRGVKEACLASSFASWRRGSRKARESELGLEQHESCEPEVVGIHSRTRQKQGKNRLGHTGHAEGCREDDFMLQAAAMIQIKSFAPFPLPLMFGCSVKMHVRNTVGRQALMFWALTQVALAGLQGPVLQPEARPRRPITRRPLSHINTVRTGSENEGRTLREQAAGPVDVDAIVRG